MHHFGSKVPAVLPYQANRLFLNGKYFGLSKPAYQTSCWSCIEEGMLTSGLPCLAFKALAIQSIVESAFDFEAGRQFHLGPSKWLVSCGWEQLADK